MELARKLNNTDPSLSINQGAIVVLGWQSCTDKGSFTRAILDALAKEYHFDLDTPFEAYPKEIHDILLYGTGGHEVKVRYKSQRGEGVYDVAFEGLIENVSRRYKETFSEASKAEYETYMRITPCPVCCVRIRPIWTCLPEQLPAVRKKDFGADSLCAGIATFSGTVSSVPSAGITGL